MARPSNLGSAAYSTSSTPSPSRTRRSKAAASSSDSALLSDSMGTLWATGANSPSTGAPTRWVGESGVRRAG